MRIPPVMTLCAARLFVQSSACGCVLCAGEASHLVGRPSRVVARVAFVVAVTVVHQCGAGDGRHDGRLGSSDVNFGGGLLLLLGREGALEATALKAGLL